MSAESLSRQWMIVHKDILVQMGTEEIFNELQAHLILGTKKIKFPDTFLVSIDLDLSSDDERNLQYHHVEDKSVFLSMGWCDTGFFTTVAMLRLAVIHSK